MQRRALVCLVLTTIMCKQQVDVITFSLPHVLRVSPVLDVTAGSLQQLGFWCEKLLDSMPPVHTLAQSKRFDSLFQEELHMNRRAINQRSIEETSRAYLVPSFKPISSPVGPPAGGWGPLFRDNSNGHLVRPLLRDGNPQCPQSGQGCKQQ